MDRRIGVRAGLCGRSKGSERASRIRASWPLYIGRQEPAHPGEPAIDVAGLGLCISCGLGVRQDQEEFVGEAREHAVHALRSGERRVGKECGRTGQSWWWPRQYKQKTQTSYNKTEHITKQ